MNPTGYPGPSAFVTFLAQALDLLSLAGIALCLCWAVDRAIRRAWTPVAVAIYLTALLAIMLSQGDAWSEVYAYGRTVTPLLLLSALNGLTVRSALPMAGMLALDPRIAFQLSDQVLKVVHGILR